MNLFLIKFHDIDSESAVYEALFDLADGHAFVPFDRCTFILRTHIGFQGVKRKLVFDLDNSFAFMAVDITTMNPEDVFIDNNLELKHMQDFIRDAQFYIDDEEEWQTTVNKLLDKGLDNLSEEEQQMLRRLSRRR